MRKIYLSVLLGFLLVSASSLNPAKAAAKETKTAAVSNEIEAKMSIYDYINKAGRGSIIVKTKGAVMLNGEHADGILIGSYGSGIRYFWKSFDATMKEYGDVYGKEWFGIVNTNNIAKHYGPYGGLMLPKEPYYIEQQRDMYRYKDNLYFITT